MGVITKRDQALFRDLGKYGLLTTTQISKRVFPGVQNSTVLRRLRALETGKWIYRIKALESGELVWILSRKGERETGIMTPMIHPNRNGVAHDVLLTEFRMSLEVIGLEQNFIPEWTIRRQTYNPERRQRDGTIVPDGIFSAVIWNGNLLSIAVELELHSKNLSRYEKIFTKYMDQRHLNLVWYFVQTKTFGLALAEKWRTLQRRCCRDPGGFIFTVISDFEKSPRKAPIYFLSGNPNSIEQYFKLPEPTQAPAHPVGRQNDAKTREEVQQSAS